MKAGSHSMSISGLNPMTRYVATVEGIDKLGNKATSDEIRFLRYCQGTKVQITFKAQETK